MKTPRPFGRCPGCTGWGPVRSDGTMQAHDHVLQPATCSGTGKPPYESGFVHGDEGQVHRTLEEAQACGYCTRDEQFSKLRWQGSGA